MSAMGAADMLTDGHRKSREDLEFRWSGLRPLSNGRDSFDDSPAIAAGPQGSGWAIWLARQPMDREKLLASRLGGDGAWGPAVVASEGALERPAVAVLPDGSAVAACVDCGDGAWRLRTIVLDRESVRPIAGPRSPGKPGHLAMASSPDGSAWLAWEAWRRGRMQVCVSRFRAGRWGRTRVVAGEERGAYDPSIACGRSGLAWVAWAANETGGHRSICMAALGGDLGLIQGPIAVARGGSPRGVCALNSHPCVACDAEDRVWVAWEHDGPDSLRSDTPRNGNWLGLREVSALCWDGVGLGAPATGPLVFGGHNDHMPVLVAVPNGGLLAASRASKGARQPWPGLFDDRRAWDVRIARLGDSGWTAPVTLLGDRAGVAEMGRLHPPCVAAGPGGEVTVVWQADTVHSREVVVDQHPPRSWINAATVVLPSRPSAGTAVTRIQAAAGEPSPHAYHIPRQRRRRVTANEGAFTVIWGNCHEHTLLSRCWGDGSDATPDEDYRYGFDIEGYDFIALTDHCFDSWEPVWRCTRRAAAFYNDPPHVVANPAYEWTALAKEIAPSSGHRNIVLASDDDARRILDIDKVPAFDRPGRGSSIDQVWELMRKRRINGVSIPHHTADADHTVNWDYHDPEFQTAVEIFQCRLSCEHRGCPRQTNNALQRDGAWVWDALARGLRMGFVASGDHNNMGIGRTALLVREVSQSGVVEALRNRRCFATTGAPIYVDFRVDGHIMGSAFTHGGAHAPTVMARIKGTAPLRDIAVIKNCRIVYSRRVDGADAHDFTWTDDDFDGSAAWYYLRVVQTDDEIAWSSPIWVDK